MTELDHISVPPAHSVLEAGGERTPILMAAIARRLDEMAAGQVLEVISLAGSARVDAVAWCHVTGHELVALVTEGHGTRFWIRKQRTEGGG